MITGVERARQELFAALVLANTGFAAQAVAGAFRAALAVAEAALVELDRAPEPEPAAVVAAFVRHVVRDRGLDDETGRLLRSLYDRAQLAQADGSVPVSEGPTAITDATTVVDAVDTWLQHADFVGIARDQVRARPGRRR